MKLFIFLMIITAGSGEGIYYITPSLAGPCPSSDDICLTMSSYFTSNKSFTDNTTVVFLPGVHNLTFTSRERIVIRDVSDFTLIGDTINGLPQSEIRCSPDNPSGFLFLNITRLTISGLTFSYCGVGNSPDIINQVFHVYSQSFFNFPDIEKMALFIASVNDLELTNVLVQNSTGHALLGINILGNSVIRNSSFLFNNFHTYNDPQCDELPTVESHYICSGGSIGIGYADTPGCPARLEDVPDYSLSIKSVSVHYGTNLVDQTIGSGITIVMAQTSYNVHVYIDSVNSTKNAAHYGANLAFVLYEEVEDSSVSINNTFSGDSNPFLQPSVLTILTSSQYIGGGLMFAIGQQIPSNFTPQCTAIEHGNNGRDLLSIMNCQFAGNNAVLGGGVSIRFTTAIDSVAHAFRFHIENCTFVENIGSPGSALSIDQLDSVLNNLHAQFLLVNCLFARNVYPTTELPNSIQQFQLDLLNTVQLISVQDITFQDCKFVDNNGTAVFALQSTIRFLGDIEFSRNFGSNGGGLSLHGFSVFLLTPNTTVRFTNNSAQFRGGGLFVSSENYRSMLMCFWQIDERENMLNASLELLDLSTRLNSTVVFSGNDAVLAGNDIYGGGIDMCQLIPTVHDRSYENSTAIFNQLFKLENVDNYQMISSDPTRVCLCIDNVPDCELHSCSVSIFSGQTFEVYAVAKGQRHGISPGVVFSEFVKPRKLNTRETYIPPVLSLLQSTQSLGKECTRLSYTIESTQSKHKMLLALENSVLQDRPTVVSITIEPCPHGFVLANDPPRCVCNSLLDEFNVACDITTETVRRVVPMWVGLDHRQDVVLLHPYCPFDYCLSDDFNLNLSRPDTQCAFNRTGKICGNCQPGYSLTLGSNECTVCSDNYLSLLLFFAFAGLFIVFLLFLCNSLNVSVGTLNGLIFYANLIQINKGIFFPPGHSNLTTVFIAWFNLDFGIKTCFYDGLDMYAKTLLQFVFPVYIWAIIGVVILLSHYFSSVAKLFGRNAVQVLATLFLLSFSKLQRTVIIGLSFTYIYHSDNTTSVVWLFNANQDYLSGKHIYLFVISFAVMLFILVPFTFLLFFATCFQALSARRLFRWVNRLKPFFDAYMAPYKDKFRFWTGFLLFVRGSLFLVYSFNVLYGPHVILFVTAMSMQLLSVFGWISNGVYRKWPLNTLEFSFYANLGILSLATLFVRYNGGAQEAVIYTSTTIAFFEFVGILTYSLYVRISSLCKCNKWTQDDETTLKTNLWNTLKKRWSTKSLIPVSSIQSTTVELSDVAGRPAAEDFADSMDYERATGLRESLLESVHFT